MCKTRGICGAPELRQGAELRLCGFSAYVFCCLETSAWDQVHVLNSAQMVGVGA